MIWGLGIQGRESVHDALGAHHRFGKCASLLPQGQRAPYLGSSVVNDSHVHWLNMARDLTQQQQLAMSRLSMYALEQCTVEGGLGVNFSKWFARRLPAPGQATLGHFKVCAAKLREHIKLNTLPSLRHGELKHVARWIEDNNSWPATKWTMLESKLNITISQEVRECFTQGSRLTVTYQAKKAQLTDMSLFSRGIAVLLRLQGDVNGWQLLAMKKRGGGQEQEPHGLTTC
eukprot:355293-Chlamydomonas_euryale.AAC.1